MKRHYDPSNPHDRPRLAVFVVGEMLEALGDRLATITDSAYPRDNRYIAPITQLVTHTKAVQQCDIPRKRNSTLRMLEARDLNSHSNSLKNVLKSDTQLQEYAQEINDIIGAMLRLSCETRIEDFASYRFNDMPYGISPSDAAHAYMEQFPLPQDAVSREQHYYALAVDFMLGLKASSRDR